MRIFSAQSFPSGFGLRKSKSKIEDEKKKDKDEDENEDGDENDDDDEDEGSKSKKSKKTKKAEDDEDDEDEDKPEARAIRAREKSRIRAIMNSAPAKQIPGAALRVALDTSMPRNAAISMLAGMASDLPKGGTSLRDRMAGIQQPDIGAGGPEAPAPGDTKVIAAAIIAAGKKARGETD